MMRPDDVLRHLTKRPFRGFRIRLTDGTSYEIGHPELAIVGKTTVTIAIPRVSDADREEVVYDRTVWVDLLHILEIEPVPSRPG